MGIEIVKSRDLFHIDTPFTQEPQKSPQANETSSSSADHAPASPTEIHTSISPKKHLYQLHLFLHQHDLLRNRPSPTKAFRPASFSVIKEDWKSQRR